MGNRGDGERMVDLGLRDGSFNYRKDKKGLTRGAHIEAVILQSDKELWYKNLLKVWNQASCPPGGWPVMNFRKVFMPIRKRHCDNNTKRL